MPGVRLARGCMYGKNLIMHSSAPARIGSYGDNGVNKWTASETRIGLDLSYWSVCVRLHCIGLDEANVDNQ